MAKGAGGTEAGTRSEADGDSVGRPSGDGQPIAVVPLEVAQQVEARWKSAIIKVGLKEMQIDELQNELDSTKQQLAAAHEQIAGLSAELQNRRTRRATAKKPTQKKTTRRRTPPRK